MLSSGKHTLQKHCVCVCVCVVCVVCVCVCERERERMCVVRERERKTGGVCVRERRDDERRER